MTLVIGSLETNNEKTNNSWGSRQKRAFRQTYNLRDFIPVMVGAVIAMDHMISMMIIIYRVYI